MDKKPYTFQSSFQVLSKLLIPVGYILQYLSRAHIGVQKFLMICYECPARLEIDSEKTLHAPEDPGACILMMARISNHLSGQALDSLARKLRSHRRDSDLNVALHQADVNLESAFALNAGVELKGVLEHAISWLPGSGIRLGTVGNDLPFDSFVTGKRRNGEGSRSNR